MKTYEGMRTGGRAFVRVISRTGYGGMRDLPPRRDLRNHSPDGFEWGYSGSGPAQLALALCADVLGDDERAMRVYQNVKATLIASLHADNWTLDEATIRQHIAQAEPQPQQSAPGHTPGPWAVAPQMHEREGFQVWSRSGIRIAATGHAGTFDLANAHLIAAAPALLAALERCADALEAAETYVNERTGEHDALPSPELQAARDAIAQAKGAA